jgi:diketogulonate reductase-like aldo/keto reductase
MKRVRTPSAFRVTSASEASSLTDCARLFGGGPDQPPVLMPWMGYGTYRLGAAQACKAVAAALDCGYRQIDTAYIYSGEKTEAEVGKALASAFEAGTVAREDVFVTTKHWRKFHGYAPALGCLERSLRRLQLDYVDCWMMHWPGPAWSTMSRSNEALETHGPWHYALEGHGQDEIVALRAETWRAMEEALRRGQARSIAVSNFNVAHLEALKRTANIWPPSINQVEMHPLYPQAELREYCAREGIVLQAYASLGGQDASKAKWEALGGRLLEASPVLDVVATRASRPSETTPAQVLLRWALQKGAAVVPKTSSAARMAENAGCFQFELAEAEVKAIDALATNAPGHNGRLCWRTDPLRTLDFD